MKRSSLFFVLAAVALVGMTTGGMIQAQESGKSGAMQMDMDKKGMDSGKNMGMNQDLGAADANYDLRFLNAMTEHHNGALVMAKDALAKSKRPEVQKLAKKIVADQQKEIAQMNAYRREWYKQ